MTTFIYVLNCPFTGKIRYVGKSDNPFKRFHRHLSEDKSECAYKRNWIKSLKSRGQVPIMDIIDEVPKSEWAFWEKEYIRLFRALGFPLVNTSEGGEGGQHYQLTEASRRKHADSIRGEKSPHWGKKFSAETRKKMSLARLGKKFPKWSDEARKRFIAARTGKKYSEKACENIRVGVLASWKRRKSNASSPE